MTELVCITLTEHPNGIVDDVVDEVDVGGVNEGGAGMLSSVDD
jgi:hypothetical protein